MTIRTATPATDRQPARGTRAVVDDDHDAHYSWVVGADEGGTMPLMRM